MNRKYIVTLTPEERTSLLSLLSLGYGPTRKLTRARILLKAEQGTEGPAWSDQRISEALDVGLATIARVRERYVHEGVEAALKRRPNSNPRTCKVDGNQEDHLAALSCSQPLARLDINAGPCACWRARWSNWNILTRSPTRRCDRC
jgi:hypothetical protein